MGLFRPITLWPFPEDRLSELIAGGVEGVLVVEMNAGQMVEDVRLVVGRDLLVAHHGRMGGTVPLPDDIVEEIKRLASAVGIG